jgi:malonyl-CoA/methylmalonyl-CoA synthetase
LELSSPSHSPAWWVHLPAELRIRDLDLTPASSLTGRWTEHWRRRPRAHTLADVDGTWLTAEELDDRTAVAAARLRAAGLAPGDRLALSAGTSARLVTAYIAALRAGLIVVPLNTAYTESEVTRIVRDAVPAAAAVDSDAHAAWIGAAASHSIPIVGPDLDGLPRRANDDEIDRAVLDDPALLVYTSGTTGQPKGALLTHGNLLASATAVNVAWRWRSEDALLLTLPLFHLHGLGVGINGSLCAGAAIVLRPRFDAGDVAEQARRGVSLFFGVPAMYERLASSGTAAALARLRLLVSGSAPLPSALADEIAEQAGQIPLERYGMTETVMLTSNPYEGARKPGTVGCALPGVRLRLGEGDEVEVTGPNVISGYFKRPAADGESFTADGWFRTGDIGAFDGDGYLRLVGRSKDLIITGGYNVHPREVEEALGTHPDVVEVAVVGRPSDKWGEEVTAVVVARRRIAPEELRAHAGVQLAPYKLPKNVEFTDELPRNALGKVIRSRL